MFLANVTICLQISTKIDVLTNKNTLFDTQKSGVFTGKIWKNKQKTDKNRTFSPETTLF